ncbi:MAG: hypothetical protein PVI44_00795 [Balneolaceae bacterium]|jgi:hypothetical protein
MGTNQFWAAFLGIFILAGCASIPREAPGLSQEIGQRMAAMEQAHLNLIHKYFDLKRAKLNEIFEEEWIPAYAESFFSQPQVSDYWDSLVTKNDKEERLHFLTRLGPRMLKRIRAKRSKFMQPLNELEAQVTDSLRSRYRQMLSANNTLTSFLNSSSKIAENRRHYLDMFGVDPDIDSFLTQADRRSEQIMETIRNANIN